MSYLKSLNPLLSVVTKRDIHVKLERCLSSRSPNKMLVLCVLYLLAVSLYLKFLGSHQATRRIAKLEQDIKKMEKLEGNVGKLETGAATEVLGQVAGQVVRERKGINNIWGIWWLAEGSIGAAFYFDGLLNVCILTISLMSLKMDPKVNLTESLPLKVREIQRVGRLSMFWSWFDFQLRGGLGLLLYLSDGEATKTLGGSGAFCFITWKWDTLPLLFGKSISSLLPLSHWILSCCFYWKQAHKWRCDR